MKKIVVLVLFATILSIAQASTQFVLLDTLSIKELGMKLGVHNVISIKIGNYIKLSSCVNQIYVEGDKVETDTVITIKSFILVKMSDKQSKVCETELRHSKQIRYKGYIVYNKPMTFIEYKLKLDSITKIVNVNDKIPYGIVSSIYKCIHEGRISSHTKSIDLASITAKLLKADNIHKNYFKKNRYDIFLSMTEMITVSLKNDEVEILSSSFVIY